MKKTWLLSLAVLAVLGVAAPVGRAADHRDGMAVKADPSTDLNDLYAWMSSDGSKVYLAMTVFPGATTSSKFSNNALYVFHTSSRASFGATGTSQNIICRFDTAQNIFCWAGDEYVAGDAKATAGVASASGKLKVFAGLRDDPFFFNLDGFNKAVDTVKTVKGSLTLDASGCPKLNATQALLIRSKLDKDAALMAPKDAFATGNALAIVVSIDKSAVTAGGPILGVWASTNKVQ